MCTHKESQDYFVRKFTNLNEPVLKKDKLIKEIEDQIEVRKQERPERPR